MIKQSQHTHAHRARGASGKKLRKKLAPSYVSRMSSSRRSVSWDKLRKEYSRKSWLLEDLVLMGHVNILAAPPKAGKSIFCLEALVRPIVSGHPTFWCTGEENRHAKHKDVLWVDTECNIAGALDHAVEHNYPCEHIHHYRTGDSAHTFDLGRELDVNGLIDEVGTLSAKLVVIDSLSGAHSGKENDSDSMKSVMRNLSKIAEKTQAAIVVIHHVKKTKGDEVVLDDLRGSNTIQQFARSILTYERKGSSESVRQLRFLGGNYAKKSLKFDVAMGPNGLRRVEAPKGRSKSAIDKARSFLRSEMRPGKTYRSKDMIARAGKRLNVSEKTLRRAAEELCDCEYGKWQLRESATI